MLSAHKHRYLTNTRQISKIATPSSPPHTKKIAFFFQLVLGDAMRTRQCRTPTNKNVLSSMLLACRSFNTHSNRYWVFFAMQLSAYAPSPNTERQHNAANARQHSIIRSSVQATRKASKSAFNLKESRPPCPSDTRRSLTAKCCCVFDIFVQRVSKMKLGSCCGAKVDDLQV